MNQNMASYLCFVAQLSHRYAIAQNDRKISFQDDRDFQNFVLAQFLGIHNEVVFLICLDNTGKLLRCCKVSLGTKHNVHLDNRTLIETALRHGATKVALAHNHPAGTASPSKQDVELTESVATAFKVVKIKLVDHLIVTQTDVLSMAGHPKYMRIFF